MIFKSRDALGTINRKSLVIYNSKHMHNYFHQYWSKIFTSQINNLMFHDSKVWYLKLSNTPSTMSNISLRSGDILDER
eukprot:UN18520